MKTSTQWRHHQIVYITSPKVKLVYEKNNQDLSFMFSVYKKSQLSGPPFSGKQGKSVPTDTVGSPVGIFLSQLGTNDRFYLSRIHVPVPARGKDKKRTTARGQHAGYRSIRDVIAMLKWRHYIIYVASQRIQDFLEAFFMFSQYI